MTWRSTRRNQHERAANFDFHTGRDFYIASWSACQRPRPRSASGGAPGRRRPSRRRLRGTCGVPRPSTFPRSSSSSSAAWPGRRAAWPFPRRRTASSRLTPAFTVTQSFRLEFGARWRGVVPQSTFNVKYNSEQSDALGRVGERFLRPTGSRVSFRGMRRSAVAARRARDDCSARPDDGRSDRRSCGERLQKTTRTGPRGNSGACDQPFTTRERTQYG